MTIHLGRESTAASGTRAWLGTLGVVLLCACGTAASGGSAEGKADGGVVREIAFRDWRVQLDLSSQVLRLEILEDRDATRTPSERGATVEAVPHPTLADLSPRGFVSASVLAQKAKQFDDGLYAAVDLALQEGRGRFGGKASLLRTVAEGLQSELPAPRGNVAGVVLGATRLGNLGVSIEAPWEKAVTKTVSGFLEDELRSKPIGFYTWSGDLRAIFQQDRILQTKLEPPGEIEGLVRLLEERPEARAVYTSYLGAVERLTNPFPPEKSDLRRLLAASGSERQRLLAEENFFFFPPSRAHETELIKRLYPPPTPIPDDFNLVEEMIRRIRAGELDLAPGPDSGWYDHQTWALEPLVVPERMPEAPHVSLGESYRRQLLDLFKGIIALTRETHIKQLEIPIAGSAPPRVVLHVKPELSAEPLVTHYLRRADSYAFVRRILENTFGADALQQMHRLTADGPVPESLGTELGLLEALFRGAYETVARELGMAVALTPHAERFQAWARGIPQDPDVGRDARMMVPVYYDQGRKKTRVWAFLGWAARPVRISFATRPRVRVLHAETGAAAEDGPEMQWQGLNTSIAYPVTAEVYVDRILDREAFRALCDAARTRSEIVARLERAESGS